MSTYVPAALRRAVIERADGLCEYCLIHESDTLVGCQIEHIISEKHGGATVLEDLAYSCAFCNRAKGTDIASISPRSGQLCRLFNPRTDRWSEHFALVKDEIIPLTDTGAATIKLLGLNSHERIAERAELRAAKRYPTSEALRRFK